MAPFWRVSAAGFVCCSRRREFATTSSELSDHAERREPRRDVTRTAAGTGDRLYASL